MTVTMNLRVSGGLKKNGGGGEKRSESLEPNLDDISQIDPSSTELFSDVLKSTSLSQQISAIKELFKDPEEARYQILAIVVVQWYFNSPLLSSVKRVLASCLNQSKEVQFLELVQEQVAAQIRRVCDMSEDDEDGDDSSSNSSRVKLIAKCLENFSCGEAGVLAELETVIQFLLAQLGGLVESICEEDVAPVDKSRYTDSACDTVRTLVTVFKGRRDKVNPELVARIKDLTHRILLHTSLPLDLRTNSGIVYVATLSQQDREQLLLDQSKDDAGSSLSIGHGTMAVFTLEELTTHHQEAKGKNMMEQLLSLYLTVAESEKETSLVMGHSRGLLNWSIKYLESAKKGLNLQLDCLESVCEYAWSHLEHHIDCVRHNTKDFLNNLILSLQLLGTNGEEVLANLIHQTLSLPIYKKSRFPALSCLVRSYSLEKVLDQYPNIREEVLSLCSEYALIGHIVDLYDNILVADYKNKKETAGEDHLAAWFQASIKPLILQFEGCEDAGSTQLVKNLLKKAVKLNPKVIDIIFKSNSTGEEVDCKLALCCLRMSREMGQPWEFDRHKHLLIQCFQHPAHNVRLQALNLCVDSHSSIELFSPPELDLILEFLEQSLALQLPAARQVLLANVKKMLTRILDGTRAMEKKMGQAKFAAGLQEMKETVAGYNRFLSRLLHLLFSNLFQGANFARRVTVLEILSLIHVTIGLGRTVSLLDLVNCVTPATAATLLGCLYDSYEENKQRALGILRELPPSLLNLNSPARVRSLLTNTILPLLISTKPPDSLTASYLVKLLVTAPAAGWVLSDLLGLVGGGGVEEIGCVKYLAVVYLRNVLVEGMAGAERSLFTAARENPLYGTLLAIRSVYEELSREEMTPSWEALTKDLISVGYNLWRLVAPVVASDSPEGHLPMDKGASELKKTFEKSLGSKTKTDVTYSSSSSSKFDLFCAVLDKVVVSDVYPDEIVEDIVDELLETTVGGGAPATTIGEAEKPVATVEASDPVESEANSDHNDGVSEDEEDPSETSYVKAKEVSSQMLLLFAWRSVKELSLFLGDLCHSYQDGQNNLISPEQILDMASFLMDLLSQTKHRGAFEQAYVAFTKLCTCLWRSTNATLHSHPSHLLSELIGSINGGKRFSVIGGGALCSTRRSAGVPFIVQAILTTDPDPFGALFKDTMDQLLQLASSQEANTENRVHACNILRALYRDTRLGDSVASFVEDGVKVSIQGFEASDWGERNSSTLLFSALVTRIFGVKREKDETALSAKNCLTGKVFFLRYPGLHSFLLLKLEQSEQRHHRDGGTLQLEPALYPILLILSRIFPSPSEAVNNPFKLSAFIPHVAACAASPILAIRQLAAKALLPLIPSVEMKTVALAICDSLRRWRKCPSPESSAPHASGLGAIFSNIASCNHVHGGLLQLEQILWNVRDPMDRKAIEAGVLDTELITQLVEDCGCRCPLISAQYLGLVNWIIKKQDSSESQRENSACKLDCDEKEPETGITDTEDIQVEIEELTIGDSAMEKALEGLESVVEQQLFASEDEEEKGKGGRDVWKPLYYKVCAEFLSTRSLTRSESGLLLKLLVHPEYEVRLRSLELVEAHLAAGNVSASPVVGHADLFGGILFEKHPPCLELLLRCCSHYPVSLLTEENLIFLLSLVSTAPNTDIAAAALRLCCLVVKGDGKLASTSRLDWATALRANMSPEQSLSLRVTVAQGLLENVRQLERPVSAEQDDRIAFVVLWACVSDMVVDDDEEVRSYLTPLARGLLGVEVDSYLAGARLISFGINRLGRVWPAASVLLVLGSILTNLEDSAEAETDSDRAFDKGEMNVYQETITTCRVLLSPLSQLLGQLSPALQAAAVKQQVPSKLLDHLLPQQLPGGVSVYTVEQLLEYIQARCQLDLSPMEEIVFLLLFQCMSSCPLVQPLASAFFSQYHERRAHQQSLEGRSAEKKSESSNSTSPYILQMVLEATAVNPEGG